MEKHSMKLSQKVQEGFLVLEYILIRTLQTFGAWWIFLVIMFIFETFLDYRLPYFEVPEFPDFWILKFPDMGSC